MDSQFSIDHRNRYFAARNVTRRVLNARNATMSPFNFSNMHAKRETGGANDNIDASRTSTHDVSKQAHVGEVVKGCEG
jgi:GDP-D-mannose dehydratase